MDTIDSLAPSTEPVNNLSNISLEDTEDSAFQEKKENSGPSKENMMDDRLSPQSLSIVSNVSTSSSSDVPQEPFKPKYKVKVSTKSITKDGESVIYKLTTTCLIDDSFGKEWKVERIYDDFQQLHQSLTCSAAPGYGLIMPPLPEDPKTTMMTQPPERNAREKLGVYTRSLLGDECFKDCWPMQEYLRLLLNHPVFGNDKNWEQFLCSLNPPPRVKLSKSSNILGKLSENIDSRGRSAHKDCEEYFQKEREWTNNYSNVIKSTSKAFNNIINARLKLCGSLSHLSTTLNLNIPGSSENQCNRQAMKFSNLFSIAIDDYQRGLKVINYNDEATLGTSLNLWSNYIEAEREMLHRRTGLMIEYEKSNRNFDKAKPHKKDEAERFKLDSEKIFEDCSDIARHEIKRLHRERSSMLLSAVQKYCQSQLLVNKDILQLLLLSFENLKQFQIESH